MESPLISCICITRKKPAMLLRSIHCFLAQTYTNKELIIVYEDDDTATRQFLEELPLSATIHIFRIARDAQLKLGAIRNYGISCAKGEYIAQWDDDDWFHEDRLAMQYQQLSENNMPGCIITRWMVYDSLNTNVYLSNERLWEGSILCRRSLFDEFKYDNIAAGEDTGVIMKLWNKRILAVLDDMPHLYIYIFHGMNTWDAEHWELMFRMGLKLPHACADLVREILMPGMPVATASAMLNEMLYKSHVLSDE